MTEATLGVTVERFVATTEARGQRVPIEIGIFVALEVCEQLLQAPATVEASRVRIGPDGIVSLFSVGGSATEPQAARGLLELLGTLLAASGQPIPPLLQDLVQHGPAGDATRLRRIRDELEAALVPLNRSAARRVLGRMVRETLRHGTPPPRGKMLDAAERAPAPLTAPTPSLDADLDALLAPPAAEPNAPTAAPSDRSLPHSDRHDRVTPTSDLRPLALDEELDALLDGDSDAPQEEPVSLPAREPSEAMQVMSAEVELASSESSRSEETPLPLGHPSPPPSTDGMESPTVVARPSRSRGPEPNTSVPRGVFATWKLPDPEDGGVPIAAPANPAKPSEPVVPSVPRREPSAPSASDAPPSHAAAVPLSEDFDEAAAIAAIRGHKGRWLAAFFALALLALLGFVAWKRPDVVARMLGKGDPTADAERAARRAARRTREEEALAAHRRRFGTLIVHTVPDHAQVFLEVGEGPAVAKDLPSGMAYEVLALAEGHQPVRSVVPAGARWAPDERARPRYELAIQLPPLSEQAKRHPVELGTTLLKPPMGEPGPLGDLRVVTNPPGAEVFLLIGFGPQVEVQDFRTDEPFELLVHAPDHDPLRLRLHPRDWREENGRMVLERRVTLTPRRPSATP